MSSDKMVPDRFDLFTEVPRELYEDQVALDHLIKIQWLRGIEEAGGIPIDDAPEIRGTLKRRGGQDILPFQDDEGWDSITVLSSGKAYRRVT